MILDYFSSLIYDKYEVIAMDISYDNINIQKTDPDFYRYIQEKKWTVDQNTDRKMFLFRIAKRSTENQDFAGKIGGILIYNQVIEQFLADIIQMSIYYIKASALPAQINLEAELDKATFGKMIESFRQFAIITPNQEIILSYLRKFNAKRNQIAHDLFDVEDLALLYRELNAYSELADEIILLLDDYDNQICKKFCRLEQQVDFSEYFP